MQIEQVNFGPRLILKATYEPWTQPGSTSGLQEVCEGIIRSAGGKNSYHEIGAARSSVFNRDGAPHHLAVFRDFYIWFLKRAEEVMFGAWDLNPEFDYQITDTWVNYHDRGGQTQAHTHELVTMASAAYISAPPGSGNIEFLDTNEQLWRATTRRRAREHGWYSIPIKQGDVFFFPGWLEHRTQASQSDQRRWVLSSNLAYLKQMIHPESAKNARTNTN